MSKHRAHMTEQEYREHMAKFGEVAAPIKPSAVTPQDGYRSKTERQYAALLQVRLLAGEIAAWKYEPVTFRLADRCGYTPDFMVLADEIQFHEVKGFWRDDARVKWKACAEQHQWARWCAVTLQRGEWVYEWYRGIPDGLDEAEMGSTDETYDYHDGPPTEPTDADLQGEMNATEQEMTQ